MSNHPLPNISQPAAQSPGAGRFKPVDPVRLLRQHVKLLSVVAVIGAVVGLGTWYVLLKTIPNYVSTAQLRVSEGIANPNEVTTGGVMRAAVPAMESYIKSEVFKIQSESILTQALNNATVRNSKWFAQYTTAKGSDFNKAREDLIEDHLGVSMVRGTQLISLSVFTPTEEDCQKIAQSIVDVYLGRIEDETNNKVGSMRRSQVTELNRIDTDIANLTKQIEDFTREHDLTNLEARLDEAALVRQQYIVDRGEMVKDLNEYQKAYDAALDKQAQGGPPSASEILQVSQEDPIRLRDERLRSLREQREVALHDFGEGHRMVIAIDRQISATEAEREREIERLIREQQQAMLGGYKQEIESLTERIADIEQEIELLNKKLVDLNVHQTQYQNLQVRLDEAKDQRNLTQNSLREVRLVEKMSDARPVQLQAPPSLPELVFPKIEIIVPAVTFLLLALVGGVIFLREMMDQSIKSPSDIKLLKETELLGILPHADEDPSGPSSVERVVEKYPTGLLAEAYRQVRTAVLGKMDRRGYKTLLIASAQPGSGASSVAHNLATSLAFNGRKVAIVDANFRRPSQHQFVNADNDRGLVDILLYGASLEDMLITVHDPDISVLPTGRAGDAPPELLECPKFRSMMAELETKFDIVLIDAPPALLSSECQLLAKHADAIAVVARAGSDKRGMIDRMAGQFAGQRADLLGVVLNGVQSSVGGYFRASFRDFYRYRENGAATNGKTNGRGRRQPAEMAEALDKD